MKKQARLVAAIITVTAFCASFIFTASSWRIENALAANTGSLSLSAAALQGVTADDAGLPSGSSPWTVEAWVNLSSNDSTGITVYWGSYSVSDKTAAYVYCGSIGSAPGRMFVYTPGMLSFDYSDSIIPIGEWHHCAITYDGGTTIRYFLDGLPAGTATIDVGPLNIVLGGTSYLGFFFDGDNVKKQYFDGLLDEVRIWSSARTQGEIRGDMFNMNSGPDPYLVAYWQLNGDYADASGNGHMLAPENSPVFSTSVPLPIRLSVRKTETQQVVSNINPQPDVHLVLTLEPNKNYAIDGLLIATSTNATPDLKFRISATSASEITIGYTAVAGTNQSGGVLLTQSSTGLVRVTANVPVPIHIAGTILMSNSGGDVVLEWAQNISNPNPMTLLRGSFLRAQEIP